MPALVFPNITAETMGWKIEEKAATRGVGGSLRQHVTTWSKFILKKYNSLASFALFNYII
jgi:hypothetical protein